MAISKRSDSVQSGRPRAAHGPQLVAVPRRWLFALAAFIIVPWLIAGALYVHAPDRPVPAPLSPFAAQPAHAASPGPWDLLMIRPVVVSPPLESVAADWRRRRADDMRLIYHRRNDF